MLQLPILDDRTFADLVDEARSLIPRYAPAWTNQNPSDPGITLIELLAYFTEMLIYRLDQVSPESRAKFLELLTGEDHSESTSVEDIDQDIRALVRTITTPSKRAVTPADYERLAVQLTHDDDKLPPSQRVARAYCATGRDLSRPPDRREDELPGNVSIVVLPETESESGQKQTLEHIVEEKLKPNRLLTTQLHVVKPFYLWVSFGVVIKRRPGAVMQTVREDAIGSLNRFFGASATHGEGPDGNGWPFGRDIYLSEVYDVLERVNGIDHVPQVYVLRLSATGDPRDDPNAAVGIQVGLRSTVGVDSRLGPAATMSDRLVCDSAGSLTAVTLQPYELVKVAMRFDEVGERELVGPLSV